MRDLLRLGPSSWVPVALKFVFDDTTGTPPDGGDASRYDDDIQAATPQILEGQRNGPQPGDKKFVESVGNIRQMKPLAQMNLLDSLALNVEPLFATRPVHFIALLGLCAAYIQGGLTKVFDFNAAVAETQSFDVV